MTVIPNLKSQVGAKSVERRVRLSETQMRDFAAAVKATRGNTSHSPISSFAAPTIFTIFRDGEFELLKKFGIELKQVLHAEQEYRLNSLLNPDEEITYTTTLISLTEKRGKESTMAFMVFETPFLRISDSAVIANAKSTILFREPKAGA